MSEKRIVSDHEWRKKKDRKLFVKEAPFTTHLDFTLFELQKYLTLANLVVVLYGYDAAFEDFIASRVYNKTCINLITCLRTFLILRCLGNEIFVVSRKITEGHQHLFTELARD